MATALVTGVTGQLGYFVAEQLASRGDVVWGMVRQSTLGRGSTSDLPYKMITGDLLDEYSLLSILERVRPIASSTSARRASCRRRGRSRS
jgi:GDPmannose 4,6-dehydratase